MSLWQRSGVEVQELRIGEGGHAVTSALGAAILAGVGIFDSRQRGVAEMVHLSRVIETDARARSIYERI